jgi:hypothetical protein
MCKHITLLLPNRPGELFKVAERLGAAQINIIGFHVAADGRSSILQLVCDKPNTAFETLHAHYKYYCTQREVLAVRLRDQPGELSRVLEVLSDRALNLTNVYQLEGADGEALVILELASPVETEQAVEALMDKGFSLANGIGHDE